MRSDYIEKDILEITSLSSEGQGVARLDGIVVFVEGAIPGDRIGVDIIKKNKTFQIGKLTEIIKPSEDRISPPCEVAAFCGGCCLQHMNYPAQCHAKQTRVMDAMTRIGGFDRSSLDAIASPILVMAEPFFYRNNIQMPIGGSPEQPAIGFFKMDSHTIVDGTDCLVIPPVVNAIRQTVRDFIQAKRISIYHEASRNGLLQHLVIRIGFRTKQVMVVLVMSKKDTTFQKELVEKLEASVREHGMNLTSVFLNINDPKTNLVYGREFIKVFGQPFIEEILGGIRYRISPASFFQVNTLQAEVLCQKVIEFAALKPTDTVFDLYCGTGSIALALASYCKKVIGVEIIEPAIADAKENAKINGIRNVEFFVGKAEDLFPEFVSQGLHANVVVVDPPRKGLDPALVASIKQIAPSKIIYVSCDPATLARDCKILCENVEYTLGALQPVDLFPLTRHVETVVLMSRVEK